MRYDMQDSKVKAIRSVGSLLALLGLALIADVACKSPSSTPPPSSTCPDGSMPVGNLCTANIGVSLPIGTRIGYFTQTANFPMQYGDTAGTSMNLGTGFPFVLKNAEGVCNRQQSSGGVYNCDAWVAGYHDMAIVMDSTSATQGMLVIRSYPNSTAGYGVNYTFPSLSQFFGAFLGLPSPYSQPIYDPLVLSTTVAPINNSKGFELRATGPTYSTAWWSLIQLQVLNGHIGDPNVNFTMYIDNGSGTMVSAITGAMNMCQTQNCGIPGL